MPERDGYIPGVPCWVDTSQPDPEAAVDFYSGLFGWEFEDVMPPGSPGKYFIGRIRGGDVAAVGSIPEGAPPMAMWNTYVWVESVDETASKVLDAGGTVLMEPFDIMDSGRMAVFADPEGAAFCGWQVLALPGGFEMWTLPGYGDHLEQGNPGLREGMAEMGAPAGFEDVVASLNPIPDDQPDTPPHWDVTFAVDEADPIAEKAVELGGKVLEQPFDAPWVRMTVIADPQGATFIAAKFVPENKDLASQPDTAVSST